jgi:hypothetical protein
MTSQNQRQDSYTRAEAKQKLCLKKAMLNNYCNALGIRAGLRRFSIAEFKRLEDLRAWTLQGHRISDFLLNNRFHRDCA